MIKDLLVFKGSSPYDDGIGPPVEIDEMRSGIKDLMYKYKDLIDAWRKTGILAKSIRESYSLGPIELPVDFVTSSRWNERRTALPLPLEIMDWKIAWVFWRGAESYRFHRDHIEKNGMLKTIIAEWFVNYDPAVNRPVHSAFLGRLDNPDWPFLVLRTGNERSLMAVFEWGWRTIPIKLVIRDCGLCPFVSALIKSICLIFESAYPHFEMICRPVTEKGGM